MRSKFIPKKLPEKQGTDPMDDPKKVVRTDFSENMPGSMAPLIAVIRQKTQTPVTKVSKQISPDVLELLITELSKEQPKSEQPKSEQPTPGWLSEYPVNPARQRITRLNDALEEGSRQEQQNLQFNNNTKPGLDALEALETSNREALEQKELVERAKLGQQELLEREQISRKQTAEEESSSYGMQLSEIENNIQMEDIKNQELQQRIKLQTKELEQLSKLQRKELRQSSKLGIKELKQLEEQEFSAIQKEIVGIKSGLIILLRKFENEREQLSSPDRDSVLQLQGQ